jgi:glycosyltransferase involved in cell wall biosynthesis
MPTLARARRADALRAAIAGVVSQVGVRAIPLVVVNGDERDRALVEELARRRDIRLMSLVDADLPAALRAGRERVDTNWFCELDDDDLLLPGTLAAQLARMRAEPECDVVVCNGVIRDHAGDRPLLSDLRQLERDPLGSLARISWLSPGGALFRTASVPAQMFDDIPRFLEWTALALRLARRCRVAFIAHAGFVHHLDTPDSLWFSRECALGLPHAIRRLLEDALPRELQRALERRFGHACHAAARAELQQRQRRAAWRWHLQALGSRDGWRFLPFTRRLLAPLASTSPP